MEQLPFEREELVQKIEQAGASAHFREAARARLDSLLVADLTKSLQQLALDA